MDDREFSDSIRKELASRDETASFLREHWSHHADAGSDLAEDETRFPDIWAATVARRLLLHANECIEAGSLLMLNGDWAVPQFALLRAVYESAGSAVWLLQPEDADVRLARLLSQHRESWRYSEKAYRGAPLDVSEQEQRQRWADSAAARLGLDLKSAKAGGYEKLIEAVDDLPAHPESLLTAWRLCSGVSHAKTWALNEVTTEIGSHAMYEHGRVSQRIPNRELFLTDLRIARRTIQHAFVLYRIRTTARPHDLVLRLVRLDADGSEVPD
ncbi:hypothetical protein GCM10027169_38440 [Gordonia jinhuaensis]|uniref:Uncharacterized protein n=1 Tax=Gordonia jinhuaensis TaxID=1517702 RepID=A0A916T211_9ACTN|nr:hypothetical protein [Gordonia jinhuaensis]GGB25371.1 hypothetical protein GCM10011489_11990 [Gordonia jinhuaensis]